MNSPQYKTWIKINKVIVFTALTVVGFIFAIECQQILLKALFLIITFILGYISFILIASFYFFTYKDFQTIIHNIIIDNITTNPSKILDIGAGSGSLSIKAAHKLTESHITAIDNFGDDWQYSIQLCMENARIENVTNVDFIKASASQLPFAGNQFDLVLSCLTFHEVKDNSSIYNILTEAFRVLDDGSEFVFFDVFLDRKIYPNLYQELESLNLQKYEIYSLNKFIKMPRILNHPKVLGRAVIIKGIK